MPSIRKEQRNQAEQWARKCLRLTTNKNPLTPSVSKPKTTPIQRIKTHLSSYDKRLPPPQYKRPEILLTHDITQHSLKDLKDKLKILTGTAT